MVDSTISPGGVRAGRRRIVIRHLANATGIDCGAVRRPSSTHSAPHIDDLVESTI